MKFNYYKILIIYNKFDTHATCDRKFEKGFKSGKAQLLVPCKVLGIEIKIPTLIISEKSRL